MEKQKALNAILQELGEDATLETFLQANPNPVLVNASRIDAHHGQKTMAASATSEAMNPWKDTYVFPIKWYEGSKFTGQFYMIGRDVQSDVVLEHPTVSKFHATIDHSIDTFDAKKEMWHLKDANSRNGTWVSREAGGDHQVKGEERCELKDGSNLRFGNASFQFYTARGFWDYVQMWKKLVEKRDELQEKKL